MPWLFTLSVAILMCGVCPLPGFARAEAPSSKALESVISQAEELMLNSERSKALDLLQSRWKVEKAKTKKILAEKMDEFARLFLTESGQQAFELGQSMSAEQAGAAESHYKEALKREDNNISILFAVAALRIREKNWSAALEELERILKLQPASRKAQVLKAGVLLANSDFQQAEALLKELEKNKDPESEKLKIALLIEQDELKKAGEALKKLSPSAKKDPETEFLNFRLQQEMQRPLANSGQNYLSLCKNISPLSLREISQSPFICMHVEEVAKIIDEIEAQTR